MNRGGLKEVRAQSEIAALYNVPAPAKINWFVHVLGRRPNGYHDLQTVFQFIDWCDWLDFERRDDGVISREGGDGLPDDDLSVRAARLLQAQGNCRYGVHIRLHKSIPAQAGLGGGSSDAASTLLALNRLWGLGLSRSKLIQLAVALGADVPVFVFGRNAFAQGIGEELAPVDLPAWSLLVGWPGRGLSTAQIFNAQSLTRNTAPTTISSFAAYLQRSRQGLEHVSGRATGGAACGELAFGFGRNDLLPVALDAMPELGALGDWLRACTGSDCVAMSGSGSAMFAPCKPELEVGNCAPIAASWRVRKCRTLLQHPLMEWASDAM